MSKAKWERQLDERVIYEGVRGSEYNEIGFLDWETQGKVGKIIEALEWTRLLIFEYSGFSRVVAPFVVGLSSDLNALMRGYQLEGVSKSGKGAGWRVFQVMKMERVDSHGEFFKPEEFDFDPVYPWIYSVLKTL